MIDDNISGWKIRNGNLLRDFSIDPDFIARTVTIEHSADVGEMRTGDSIIIALEATPALIEVLKTIDYRARLMAPRDVRG